MVRIILTITACLLLEILDSSEQKMSKYNEQKYYVATAWEYTYDTSSPGVLSQIGGEPVVSNVAYVDCEYSSDIMVTNALSDFYDAYYRKYRGTTGLNRAIGWSYDTYDEAIAHRRKLIGDYNFDWTPLLITGFTVPCT